MSFNLENTEFTVSEVVYNIGNCVALNVLNAQHA